MRERVEGAVCNSPGESCFSPAPPSSSLSSTLGVVVTSVLSTVPLSAGTAASAANLFLGVSFFPVGAATPAVVTGEPHVFSHSSA